MPDMPAFNLDAVKRVPKLVWVVGGGVIVGFVILTRGKGGGSPVAGVGSTGGAGAGQGDQPVISSTDLSTFLADQSQAQNDFYQSIIDSINGLPRGGGGGGGGTVPTPKPTPTPIPKPTPSPTPKPTPSPTPTPLPVAITAVRTSGLARLFQLDAAGILRPVYNATNAKAGFTFTGGVSGVTTKRWTADTSGPFTTPINSAQFRQITSGPHKGMFIRVTDMGVTYLPKLPVAPPPAPYQPPIGSKAGSGAVATAKH